MSCKYNIVNKCKKILVCDRCPVNMKFQKRISELFLVFLLCSFHTSQPSRVEGNTHTLHCTPHLSICCTSHLYIHASHRLCLSFSTNIYSPITTTCASSSLSLLLNHYHLCFFLTTICSLITTIPSSSSPQSILLTHHHLHLPPLRSSPPFTSTTIIIITVMSSTSLPSTSLTGPLHTTTATACNLTVMHYRKIYHSLTHFLLT